MWVPHKELKKKKKKRQNQLNEGNEFANRQLQTRKFFFLIFFFQIFFLRFTETCPSEFVGINTESALRDEGYA